MSSQRNASILADQQGHSLHPLPSYQPGYTTGPPSLSSVPAQSTHQHQVLPGVSSLSTPRYPPPPHAPHPPRLPHPPAQPPQPPSLHSSMSQSHAEAHEKSDHGYNGTQSGHATPVIKAQREQAPYQRSQSTLGRHQGQTPPGLERPPMENGHPAQPLYAGPAHPDQHHMMYPPQQHHPGPVMMDPGHYAPQPIYHAAPGYAFTANMHMANQNARRKSSRASQACDKCRERKSKCDEQRPCATCKEQNIECHYKDSQPSKIDKNNAQLGETLQAILDQTKAIHDRMTNFEHRVGNIEGQLDIVRVPKAESMSREGSRNDTPALLTDQDQDEAPALCDTRQPISTDQSHTTDLSLPDPPRRSRALGTDFTNHLTGTHKLLQRWPSIHRLLGTRYPDNYPLQYEDRGCLRLHNRGEGVQDDDVAIGATSPAQSTGSNDFGVSSPDGMNISLGNDEPRRSDPGSYTRMEMDAITLQSLFERYKKHLHRLHPFLDIDQFSKYMRWFIKTYSTDSISYSDSPRTCAKFVSDAMDKTSTGVKRRRTEAFGPGSQSSTDFTSKRRATQPERTVINAIVYLVFALGKVCHAPHVPGPYDPSPLSPPDQAVASPVSCRPSPMSPPLVTRSQTPMIFNRSTRHESMSSTYGDSPGPGVGREYNTNADKIPGLVYYREAASILGDFADANDLASAQARLLAALYKGQLSRVQESWSWLHMASRTCQFRIRLEGLIIDDPENETPQKEFNKAQNLTLRAYWTCLQLESDILAEMDYPHSGLSAMEGSVYWPNNILDEEASRKIVSQTATDLDLINIYYSAQLFLRKHLNQIHRHLYSETMNKEDPRTLASKLENLDQTLQQWRDLRHPITYWHDREEPPQEILAARLRAKYYGARYVITRPFLDYTLHVLRDVESGCNLEDITKDAKGNVRPQELVLFKAINMMPVPTIIEKVKICVESATMSTIALDNAFERRLIVTNIMGTAHAQFGNILVLAAVNSSSTPWLSELVPREKLQSLLDRTIDFLSKLQESSHTAYIDMSILLELRTNLGFSTDRSNASFSR